MTAHPTLTPRLSQSPLTKDSGGHAVIGLTIGVITMLANQVLKPDSFPVWARLNAEAR